MSEQQEIAIKQLADRIASLMNDWHQYWWSYSNMGTWGFWINLVILLLPLIVLWMALDRTQAFRIGFFGYSAHVAFTYIDQFGINMGFWVFPFQVVPLLNISFGLDASLVPIVYMLVYQWTINRNKNYYLYALLLSIIFSFVLKPIMVYIDLFRLYRGTNYINLFVGYVAIGLYAKWITDLFAWFQNRSRKQAA